MSLKYNASSQPLHASIASTSFLRFNEEKFLFMCILLDFTGVEGFSSGVNFALNSIYGALAPCSSFYDGFHVQFKIQG